MEPLVSCQWCGTTNQIRRHKCVVCEIEIGIPPLQGLRGRDIDTAILSAYTRGGARHIAERLADGRLPWRNNSIQQRCIRVALAESIPELNLTLDRGELDDSSDTFLGWRWPTSPLSTSARIYLVKNQRSTFTETIRRDSRRRAVNLSLPSSKKLKDVDVYFSLQTEIEALAIRTRPRVVHSTMT